MKALRIALALAAPLLLSSAALSQCPAISVSSAGLGNGTLGQAYSGSVTASPAGVYLFEATGLPATLSIDSSTGAVTGTPGTSGTFPVRVVVTDATGCVGTHVFPFQVCDAPSVSIAAAPSTTICPGDNVTFTATPTAGGPSPTYQWKLNGGNVGTNSNTYSSTTLADGDQVTVDMTSNQTNPCVSGGPVTSNTLTITLDAAPSVTLQPTNQTVVAGLSASFTATASGTPAPTVQWQISTDGGGSFNDVGGATSTTYTFATVAGDNNHQFRARFTNSCGSNVATNAATLTVTCPSFSYLPASGSMPQGTFNDAYSQNVSVSGGSSSTYTLTATASTLAGTNLSFADNGNGTATISGTPNHTGLFGFTLDVTDGNGCTGSQAFTVAIGPNLTAKTYTDVGNTELVGGATAPGTPYVAASGVAPGDTSDVAITYAIVTGPALGALTTALSGTGTFVYTPDAGNMASDAFVYSGTSNGVSTAQTATINFTNKVWYVNGVGAAGDGRSQNPFNSLASASAVLGAGEHVFAESGGSPTTTPGDITLQASSKLYGQGVALPLAILNTGATTKPVLTGTVTLADDVTVAGCTFNPSGAIPAITSSGITGTSTIDQNAIAASNAATAVSLTGGTGTINFTATPISQSGGGTGLAIGSKTGGTVSFDAASTVSVTGAGATGINLTTNTGATISFAGTLTLTTTTGPAFVATGGGTVTATASANVISTTTGTALNVANTTIGAAGLTFQSVSSNGGANGISLNATGSSGGLQVTGTGTTAGSGGTIQNKTGPGVLLMSTSNVSLHNMNVQNGTDDGIHGESVTGLDLVGCNVTGNGNSTLDDGLQLGLESGATVGITGTLDITNTSISANAHNGVHIRNTSGTIAAMNVTGSTFNNATGPSSANAFLFEASGTSTTTAATITSSTFANSTPQRALEVQTHDTATIASFTVQTSTFTNNGIHASFTQDTASNLTFRFLNNLNMTGSLLQAVNVFSSSTSTGGNIFGRIQGNTIGNAGVPGSGSNAGSGVRVLVQGRTTSSILIDANTIRQVGFTSGSRGLDLQYLGPTAVAQPITQSDLTITNNLVQTDAPGSTFPLAAIFIGADNQGSPARVRADVRSNTVPATGSWDYPGFDGVTGAQLAYLLVTVGAQAQLVDNPPASATAQAELTSQNTGFMYGDPAVTLIAGPITTPP